jgi:hypothetical protein
MLYQAGFELRRPNTVEHSPRDVLAGVVSLVVALAWDERTRYGRDEHGMWK